VTPRIGGFAIQGDEHMAAKKPKPAATGTVQARREAEAERQKQARATRDQLAADTRAAQNATAKRLADKPAATRNL
jgi:hypothetical protein